MLSRLFVFILLAEMSLNIVAKSGRQGETTPCIYNKLTTQKSQGKTSSVLDILLGLARRIPVKQEPCVIESNNEKQISISEGFNISFGQCDQGGNHRCRMRRRRECDQGGNHRCRTRQRREIIEDEAMQKQLEEIGERLTFTCRDKCGKTKKKYPCSCSSVCVLYDSCCENITQDCPNVVTEGYSKYTPFIDEQIICDKTNVHVIASSPCSLGEDNLPTSTSDLSDEELNQYLLNAPVTDAELGLTFRSRALYDCYQTVLNMSHTVLPWGLNLVFTHAFSYQTSFSRTLQKVPYKPTFDETVLQPHSCSTGVVNSCEGGSQATKLGDDRYNHFSKRCAQFTGLVTRSFEPIYRNRYCAYCQQSIEVLNGFEMKPITAAERSNTVLWSVLMSLSEDGSYILDLDHDPLKPRSWAWATAKCPGFQSSGSSVEEIKSEITDNNNNEKKPGSEVDSMGACEAIDCGDPTFTIDSEGTCRTDYHMLVAFKDNEMDLPPLDCPSAMHQLGQFLTCGLELTLNSGPWENAGKFVMTNMWAALEFDSEETFYFLDIMFSSAVQASRTRIFQFAPDDEAPNIHSLAIVVKAYQELRLIKDICPPPGGDLKSTSKITVGKFNYTALTKRVFTPEEYLKRLQYVVMPRTRGHLIDDENATVVCMSTISHVSEEPRFECYEDLLYSRDREAIDQLVNSSCVDLLNPVQHTDNWAAPSSLPYLTANIYVFMTVVSLLKCSRYKLRVLCRF